MTGDRLILGFAILFTLFLAGVVVIVAVYQPLALLITLGIFVAVLVLAYGIGWLVLRVTGREQDPS